MKYYLTKENLATWVRQWRNSLPRFSEREWLKVFPQAEPVVRQKIREYEKQLKALGSEIYNDLLRIYKLSTTADEFSVWFVEKVIEVFKGEKLEWLVKNIQRLKWGLAKKKRGVITDEQIRRAKEYPFENLIESKRSFAYCPFHPDKRHPNFYIKNNFGHCFACGWSGDAIKFVMEKNGVDFKTAVKYLS